MRDERKSQYSVEQALLKNTTSLTCMETPKEMVAGRYLYENAGGVTDGYSILCSCREGSSATSMSMLRAILRQITAGSGQRPSTAASILSLSLILGTHERGVKGQHCVLPCEHERTCSLTPYTARRENGEAAPDEQMFGEHHANNGELDELSMASSKDYIQEDDSMEAEDYIHEDDSTSEDSMESEYEDTPEITLSSLTETGQAESTIPVLKQRSYTGAFVIPSALANTPCADLGVFGFVENLNAALGASYTADEVHPVLNSILDFYGGQNNDFGTAYAHFHGVWGNIVAFDLRGLRDDEEKDREMRQNALGDGRITESKVPPRRVWGLEANRVVPYWMARKHKDGSRYIWGISHAWMDEKERVNVMTPINGYEWPVPIPKDANLDLIRIEMLNLGAEYAWLDVLCLRQPGGRGEHLRKEEWKLDVPTIGYVYDGLHTSVVCYFNGLGRPLSWPPDFDSDRSWFRRAWTLQEITAGVEQIIIGGQTGDDSISTTFRERLKSLNSLYQVENALSQMQKRISTNPMDRVAGLAYLLYTKCIPTYDAEQSEESAWAALVNAMVGESRLELLFCYPEPGNGGKCWRASWKQVMNTTFLSLGGVEVDGETGVGRTDKTDVDWYQGLCINSAKVRGLADTSDKEMPRQGELVFKDDTEEPLTFDILADHQYSIPDGSYTLLGCKREKYDGEEADGTHRYIPITSKMWVVGQQRPDGTFEKLSVVSVDGNLESFSQSGVKIVLC
ncbi:hypothetical protein ARMGADRAFT_1079552 [Armillaria gallica]|uniref:Heterokaryon incompatibility domain-containing protein n=1 Tax=Armillaria gallica TaxID=47427 RepID=A0A2H3DFT7_ARMGA|nr:hypothetical protein ARMGADRAFT_1079552 [Armillaria gallica]